MRKFWQSGREPHKKRVSENRTKPADGRLESQSMVASSLSRKPRWRACPTTNHDRSAQTSVTTLHCKCMLITSVSNG